MCTFSVSSSAPRTKTCAIPHVNDFFPPSFYLYPSIFPIFCTRSPTSDPSLHSASAPPRPSPTSSPRPSPTLPSPPLPPFPCLTPSSWEVSRPLFVCFFPPPSSSSHSPLPAGLLHLLMFVWYPPSARPPALSCASPSPLARPPARPHHFLALLC